jgi:hypothetical protein
MRVSAQLTDSGTEALATYLGPNIRAVDGRLVTATDQQLVIAVVAVKNRDGIDHYWKGESVTLARSEIATLQQKKLAVARTTFFVAVSLTGAILGLRAFGAFGPGILGGNGHPNTQ